MLSRKTNRYYEILEDGERIPYKLPKGATDNALREIHDNVRKVNQVIQKLWERDTGAYYFVMTRILPYDIQHDEGKVLPLQDMECDAKALLEELQTRNDEIPVWEKVAMPEDYGYRKLLNCENIWEKTLRDDENETVTEELVVRKDGTILRRLRTIQWETKPGMRTSTAIRYRKLRLGKRLEAACRNACDKKMVD